MGPVPITGIISFPTDSGLFLNVFNIFRAQKESGDEDGDDDEDDDDDDDEDDKDRIKGRVYQAQDGCISSSEDEDGEEKLVFQEKKPQPVQEDVAVAPGTFKGFSFKKKETARPPIKARTLKW